MILVESHMWMVLPFLYWNLRMCGLRLQLIVLHLKKNQKALLVIYIRVIIMNMDYIVV